MDSRVTCSGYIQLQVQVQSYEIMISLINSDKFSVLSGQTVFTTGAVLSFEPK